MKKLTPEWERYLDILKMENKKFQEEEAIKYIQGESGSWKNYAEGARAISEYLISMTKKGENISFENVPPALVHAIMVTAISMDDIGKWDSDGWRTNLMYAKQRLLNNAKTTYPSPSGENYGIGNTWGSFSAMFNTNRGKNGQDLDR